DDSPGGKRLVAYLVGHDGAVLEAAQLRSFLQGKLPDYMVPSAFVFLEALPLTPNGKLDRKALPAPDREPSADAYVAPRTATEEVPANIWAEVLGLGGVGIHDNFFELGGHSLLATQAAARMRTAYPGIELPLRLLFEQPTVAALAQALDQARRDADPGPPLLALPRAGELPLSFAQQRLWFLDQLEPGSPFYNMPPAFRVAGPLELDVLGRVVTEIVRRHEVLRTSFPSVEGRAVQRIAAPVAAAL